ncbi:MAG: serine hydrolase, partial [Candidatus Zixiibacteriota bacterium]
MLLFIEMKRPRSRLILLALTLVVVTASTSSVLAQTLNERLDEYLTAAQRVLRFTGAVIVAKDGEIVLSQGYGMADRADSIPNTPDTKYLLASITKQFTAAGILQLVERKQLSLNHPVSKYLPDYPKKVGDRVTIYHLLTHTSGIAEYTTQPQFGEIYLKPATHEEVVATFKDIPLQIEPGSEWRYSNSGYYLLGLIIEEVSGEPYGEYIRKHIFEPLGMQNSGYPQGWIDFPGLATGYTFDSTGNLIPAEIVYNTLPYAAGGLYSTVNDMAKWDAGLRNGRVLGESSLSKMFTPFKWRYALGWEIDTLFGHTWAYHGGQGAGFCTAFMRFVDDPFCVAVLSNSDAGNVDRIAFELAAIAYGEPYDIPVTKTPITIDNATLDDYVGVYELDPDRHHLVTREGDSLFVSEVGGKRSLLMAEAEDKFLYARNYCHTITFVRDTAGKVVEHIFHHRGSDERALRIEGDK